MKRHKTEETEPCSPHLNGLLGHKAPIKMYSEGGERCIYIHRTYLYVYACIEPLLLPWTRPLKKDNLHYQ